MTATMAARRDEPELSMGGACALLGVSAPELLRLMSEEKLPGHLVQGEWRYSRAELVDWSANRRAGARETRAQTPDVPDGGRGSTSGDR